MPTVEEIEEAVTVLLCMIAVIGNLLVFSVMCTSKSVRAVKTRYFIVSITVSGLVHSLFVMPLYTFRGSYTHITLGKNICSAWFATDFMARTILSWSIAMVCWDRNKQVTNPLSHRDHMTTCRVMRSIAILWMGCAGLYYPAFFLNWNSVLWRGSEESQQRINATQNETPGNKVNASAFQCDIRYDRSFLGVSIFITWVIPGSVLLCNYTGLYISVVDDTLSQPRSMSSNHHSRTSRFLPQNQSPVGSRRPTQNLSRTGIQPQNTSPVPLGLVVLFYVVMVIPGLGVYVSWLVSETADGEVFHVFMWLVYANSCMNPLIFPLSDTCFRRAFKSVLTFRAIKRDQCSSIEPLYVGNNTMSQDFGASYEMDGHLTDTKHPAKK